VNGLALEDEVVAAEEMGSSSTTTTTTTTTAAGQGKTSWREARDGEKAVLYHKIDARMEQKRRQEQEQEEKEDEDEQLQRPHRPSSSAHSRPQSSPRRCVTKSSGQNERELEKQQEIALLRRRLQELESGVDDDGAARVSAGLDVSTKGAGMEGGETVLSSLERRDTFMATAIDSDAMAQLQQQHPQEATDSSWSVRQHQDMVRAMMGARGNSGSATCGMPTTSSSGVYQPLQTGLAKISREAVSSGEHIQSALGGVFEQLRAPSMDPGLFKKVLRSHFLINLTPAELGALVFYFDPSGQRRVDTNFFMKEFYRLGAAERQRIRKKQLRHRKHHEKVESERIRKETERLLLIRNPDTQTGYDVRHLSSGLGKIKVMSMDAGNRCAHLSPSKAFSLKKSMSSGEFQRTLLGLGIRVTNAELTALCGVQSPFHDHQRPGCVISTVSFMRKYFELSQEGHTAALSRIQKLQKHKRERAEREAAEYTTEMLAIAEHVRVMWPPGIYPPEKARPPSARRSRRGSSY
jgi:hypothetical protein